MPPSDTFSPCLILGRCCLEALPCRGNLVLQVKPAPVEPRRLEATLSMIQCCLQSAGSGDTQHSLFHLSLSTSTRYHSTMFSDSHSFNIANGEHHIVSYMRVTAFCLRRLKAFTWSYSAENYFILFFFCLPNYCLWFI